MNQVLSLDRLDADVAACLGASTLIARLQAHIGTRCLGVLLKEELGGRVEHTFHQQVDFVENFNGLRRENEKLFRLHLNAPNDT